MRVPIQVWCCSGTLRAFRRHEVRPIGAVAYQLPDQRYYLAERDATKLTPAQSKPAGPSTINEKFIWLRNAMRAVASLGVPVIVQPVDEAVGLLRQERAVSRSKRRNRRPNIDEFNWLLVYRMRATAAPFCPWSISCYLRCSPDDGKRKSAAFVGVISTNAAKGCSGSRHETPAGKDRYLRVFDRGGKGNRSVARAHRKGNIPVCIEIDPVQRLLKQPVSGVSGRKLVCSGTRIFARVSPTTICRVGLAPQSVAVSGADQSRVRYWCA